MIRSLLCSYCSSAHWSSVRFPIVKATIRPNARNESRRLIAQKFHAAKTRVRRAIKFSVVEQILRLCRKLYLFP